MSSLFNCLSEIIYDLPWKTSEYLHMFVGVSDKFSIHTKYITNIENKMNKKYAIYVYDSKKTIIRNSDIVSHFQVHLMLENYKYTLMKNNKLNICINTKEKPVMVYRRDKSKDIVHVYYGESIRQISVANYLKYNKDKNFKFLLISIDDKIKLPKDAKIENTLAYKLKKTYENFITMANSLKEATNGQINMYITGKATTTAKVLFYKTIKSIITEKIDIKEGLALLNASRGGLCYAEVYNGPGHSYDFTSMYPSIMIDYKMLFPIKKGEFVNLDIEEFNKAEFVTYGIYRCKIYKPDNKFTARTFLFNKKNEYTHIDINSAKQSKFKIELIVDDKPNALLYSKDKLIQGNHLFGDYINYLFPLKQQNIIGSKLLTNCLWGALSEGKLTKKFINNDDTKITNIFASKEIIDIIPMPPNKTLFMLASKHNFYKTEFARIKPFIVSKGRYKLKQIIMHYIKDIKYMHTDGFILPYKLDITTGTKIGELKYEGYNEKTIIVNINKKTDKKEFN